MKGENAISALRKAAFPILHGLWAATWLALSVILVVVLQKPQPGSVLLFGLIIGAGVGGHALLALTRFCKRLGDRRLADQLGYVPPWPWIMVVVAALVLLMVMRHLPLLFIPGLLSFGAINVSALGILWIVLEASILVGLLLRAIWAKWLLIGYAGYWLLMLLWLGFAYWQSGIYQRVDYSLLQLLFALAVSGALLLVMLLSRTVDAFFRPPQQAQAPDYG